MISNFFHILLQHLIWYVVKSLILTYKFEVRGKEHAEKAKTTSPNKSYVYAVWHEQVLGVMAAHAWTEPYLALASRSKDGDYAAFVSKKIGFVSVRGSSRKKRNQDKGGKEAMFEYIGKMKQGISGGITVDGPKGPRQQCKAGVVVIAQQTGSPVLPVVGIANRYWEFNSWDRFKIPKPFAKIIIQYGEPVFVPFDASSEVIEQCCAQIGETMKSMATEILKSKSA